MFLVDTYDKCKIGSGLGVEFKSFPHTIQKVTDGFGTFRRTRFGGGGRFNSCLSSPMMHWKDDCDCCVGVSTATKVASEVGDIVGNSSTWTAGLFGTPVVFGACIGVTSVVEFCGGIFLIVCSVL